MNFPIESLWQDQSALCCCKILMLVFLAAEKNGGSVRSVLDLKSSSQFGVLFYSASGPREVSVPETAHSLQ
jgi:hypothetical protein